MVEVHVEGRIAVGRLADFMEGVRTYCAYAETHGYARAHVLQGLSGAMNTVRLVYTYPDLAAYEADEARDAEDREYARVASELPFVDGTVTYTIYRQV